VRREARRGCPFPPSAPEASGGSPGVPEEAASVQRAGLREGERSRGPAPQGPQEAAAESVEGALFSRGVDPLNLNPCWSLCKRPWRTRKGPQNLTAPRWQPSSWHSGLTCQWWPFRGPLGLARLWWSQRSSAERPRLQLPPRQQVEGAAHQTTPSGLC